MRSEPSWIIDTAAEAGVIIATAESLTGGALVSRLVDVPGASSSIAGGAVCYSARTKTAVLGVDAAALERDGAVTERVAREMAEGALRLYDADLAVSTTGVAGPGPDHRGIPAGTVHLALARAVGGTITRELRVDGDREQVRSASVDAALELLRSALEELGDGRAQRPPTHRP